MKTIVHPGCTQYTGLCSECGCEFTYERSDVHHNYRNGGEEVGCPTCGHGVRHFGEAGSQWPLGGRWRRLPKGSLLVRPS